MRLLFNICFAVLAALGARGEHPAGYTFQKDVNGHHIEVRLKLERFDPKQHKLERKDGVAYVDGMIPIGSDNSFTISTQFSQFQVLWDGHPVNIPKSVLLGLIQCFFGTEA